ncbi:hypothetical protein CSUI_004407 [Cystoisospora suis]|uniref:Uncharacterized protein n=1 Tax=Cystoisospora suis TaxID=483139 RepID=A0A2C6KXE5_9APIC|nr:hypothetical protein CSUI_004407 [Cystoisospora suis]
MVGQQFGGAISSSENPGRIKRVVLPNLHGHVYLYSTSAFLARSLVF